jgi:hypothetical protein
MRTLLRWIFRVVKWVAIFCGMCIVIYIPYAWWESRQLHTLCSEIKSGMAVAELPPLVEKYGFDQRLLRKRGYQDSGGNWILHIPTTTSMGEYGCHIMHDTVKVISAATR